MKGSVLQRLTTWLCLVAALLMGVAPAGRLVLCFAPDGTVALEVAVEDNHCPGCAESSEPNAPSSVSVLRGEERGCACLDVPVLRRTEAQRVSSSTIELDLGPATAPYLGFWREEPTDRRVEGTRSSAPRPPLDLALIRSVVLLV